MSVLTWIHLSDLHANSPKYGWDSGEILRSLDEDLERVCTQFGLDPDLLFFTGDAAFGTRDGISIDTQFDEAWRILGSVRQRFKDKLSVDRCFIVPGNHDLDRNRILRDNQEWLSRLKDPNDLAEMFSSSTASSIATQHNTVARFVPYREFLRRAGLKHCGADDMALRYASTLSVNGIKVGIAGFNSAIMCSRDEEQAKLVMGARWQANFALPQIADCDVKIALVHHPDSWLHPLEKLSRDLSTQVDFILHGHEHDQWIDPPSPPERGIISNTKIGASALYDRGTQANGYSIVRWNSKTRRAEVFLREYEEKGRGWRGRVMGKITNDFGVWPKSNSTRTKPKVSRSDSRPSERKTPKGKPSFPYYIDQVACGSLINDFGDTHRIVECNDIRIGKDRSAVDRLRVFHLPGSAGYVDPGFVRSEIHGGRFPGFRHRFESTSPKELSIDFHQPLLPGDRFGIEYSWWALNEHTLDERQYRKQYRNELMVEEADFPVLHPIGELLLYVRFPRKMVETSNFDLPSNLSVDVSPIDDRGNVVAGPRDYETEDLLRPQIWFMRHLRVACLSIREPKVGFSYGITWRVPPLRPASPHSSPGENRQTIHSIESSLLSTDESRRMIHRQVLQRYFELCIPLFRRYVTAERRNIWRGEIELSLMVFDGSDCLLKIVGGTRATADDRSATPFSRSRTLGCGQGIAGRAYKNNIPLLWVKTPNDEKNSPDPFVVLDEEYQHKVLLAIPLQNPDDDREVFAVMNCGSNDPTCPLLHLNHVEINKLNKILKDLQVALSEESYSFFSKVAPF
ncbi:metallophosphoesterase [Terriglobus sp. TAA 43]|uniref:metallophosphoesterase family protein n=1 Tax=Terriglobus sp. TAA 43 TaxID=278961 RepID=UPI00064864CF|nr:metallophosphoesterase [Terriglobus sp. TAA 43]